MQKLKYLLNSFLFLEMWEPAAAARGFRLFFKGHPPGQMENLLGKALFFISYIVFLLHRILGSCLSP